MGAKMKNKDLKLSLIFTIVGTIAGALISYYQVSTATGEFMDQLLAQLGSIEALIFITAIESAIFTFISTFFGLKLARKVNLQLYAKLDRKSMILVGLIGLFTSIVITFSDKYIFASYLPETTEGYQFSFLYFVSSLMYGGIIEELMLRLFLMSLLIWIGWKLFAKSKDSGAIPSWIYLGGIVVAAILFGLGHLPATAQAVELTTPIVIRAIVLNGVGGIGFGYLYWKFGLSHAMYAHMLTHIINQLIFMPILF